MSRWAKKPPNCKAMDAANKAVWEKYPEALEYDSKTGKGRKIKPDDPAEYRTAWMDAYAKACGDEGKYITRTNPHLKPGELRAFCNPTPVPVSPAAGILVVMVLDASDKDKPIAGAQVDVTGGKTGTTDASGYTTTGVVSAGPVDVIVGKEGYDDVTTSAIIPESATATITVELKQTKKAKKKLSDIWIGLGESHSGDLVVVGRYNWNARVYRMGAETPEDVEWASLSASGWKLGGGLGGSVSVIVVFAHGITSAGQFKSAAKWGDLDFDLALGTKLSAYLKGLRGIGKVVKTIEKYKKLDYAAQQLIKHRGFRKRGVYQIPIPLAGGGLHVWFGRQYGGIDLSRAGKGL